MLEVRSQTLGAGVELETQVPNWAVFFFFRPLSLVDSHSGKRIGWSLADRETRCPPQKSTQIWRVFFLPRGSGLPKGFPLPGISSVSSCSFSIDKMSKKTICGVGSGVLGCGQDFFRSFLESGFLRVFVFGFLTLPVSVSRVFETVFTDETL